MCFIIPRLRLLALAHYRWARPLNSSAKEKYSAFSSIVLLP